MRMSRWPDVGYLVAAIWLIHGVNMLTNYSLNQFGVMPRSMSGLLGIPLAPFLHGSLWHVVSNTLPLLILGFLLQLHGSKIFWGVTFAIALLGGAGVWIFGSSAYHVGASGLVFGYWSFLLFTAYYTKNIKSIFIAMGALVLYGGLIFGLLDMRAHISWSGHFFGFLAGIAVAFLMHKTARHQ